MNAVTMKTQSGFQTQAVFGMARTVIELKTRYPKDQLIVLNDGHADFRYEIYPQYKANRKPKSIEDEMRFIAYKAQSKYIKRLFETLGVPSLLCLNLEADDLASFLVTRKADRKVKLITSDRDWLLMVRDGVDWFDLRKNFYITKNDLYAKTGVYTVNQFLVKKALMGDASDNINGVGGFGEKRASNFALNYHGLEDFINKAKHKEKLTSYEKHLFESQEAQSIYARNLKLMDIRERKTIDKDKLVRVDGKFDENAFLDLCEELELKTFIYKIKAIRSLFDE